MFMKSALGIFRGQKRLADGAIGQLTDAQLKEVSADDLNSVAVVMKHMAGNMRSRWTDFLTTDGEKPDRHRDEEFIDRFTDRAELIAAWETGWSCFFDTLESLTDDDLARTVTIRQEPHTVIEAIHRQMGHYGYHVGQIVMLARQLRGSEWESLSIPRGESRAYNEKMDERWGEGSPQ